MSSRLWLAAAIIAAFGAQPAQAEPAKELVEVTLDQAKVIRLPAEAKTIILGNPTFADVIQIKDTDLWDITAKGFGETNLIALSLDGRVVAEKELRVLRPKSLLVFQNGASRVSYACNPDCMPTVQLGDDNDVFNKTGAQLTMRNEIAQGTVSANTSSAGK